MFNMHTKIDHLDSFTQTNSNLEPVIRKLHHLLRLHFVITHLLSWESIGPPLFDHWGAATVCRAAAGFFTMVFLLLRLLLLCTLHFQII